MARPHLTGRVIRPGTPAAVIDRLDAQDWMAIPAEERFAAAWHLSLEQWTLHPGGKLADESGLSRLVARVRRR